MANAPSPRSADFVAALSKLWPGREAEVHLAPLPGEASTRSYIRAGLPGGTPASAMIMQLPDGDLPIQGELPFLNVQRFLRRKGVRVPQVYVEDLARGVVVLEDLGDETFGARLERTPRAAWTDAYAVAIDTLARLHDAFGAPEPACMAFERSFDRALLRWELDHFREWGIEALTGPLSPPHREALDRELDALTERLLSHPQAVAHRDYQSRNLMWLGDELCVIDFQDALSAPESYDLVALLCDSYVPLEEAEQTALLARYAEARGWDAAALARLTRGFWEVAVQRKLKDAGRFVFLDRVRQKPGYLGFFAPTLKLVGRALDHAGLDALASLLHELVPGFPDAVATPASAHASDADG